ncbi:MAG: hypothetical protein BRD45_00835 [Bacteroidetes bacterium QS_8_64_10]|nr:MAG: hypothetical protein BRD45_00835 [Bacteroidetes bacterium QS_8_64_10]
MNPVAGLVDVAERGVVVELAEQVVRVGVVGVALGGAGQQPLGALVVLLLKRFLPLRDERIGRLRGSGQREKTSQKKEEKSAHGTKSGA